MRRSAPRVLVLCAALLALAAGPLEALAQARVVVVDLQRALLSTEAGRAARDRLMATYNSRQRELDLRQQRLRDESSRFEQESSQLTPDERRRRQELLSRELASLQQDFSAYQAELQRREQEASGALLAQLRGLLPELRQRHGAEAVVERSAVLEGAVPANADLTEELIRLFEQRFGRSSGSPPPPSRNPPPSRPPGGGSGGTGGGVAT